ncbi:CocE/NonD family hydrolase [Candidatus Similichlamydia epinepheli]|uniref:CocE/NonD family hydrolase n=1 Tax=Candidatus Similichlamydia epinepheli TaxID=1903953 RepID=UPI000D342BDD|nr:CocE/NonD family hydrolase [Candidatus Similichlamydia epinepheli]
MTNKWVILLFFASITASAVPLFDRTTKRGSFQATWRSSTENIITRNGTKLEILLFPPESTPPPWPSVILLSPYEVQKNFLEQLLPLKKKGYLLAYLMVKPSLMDLISKEVVFQDLEDVCLWLSKNAVCNGNIGMWGFSASSIINTILGGQGIPGLNSIYSLNASPHMLKETLFLGDVPREDVRDSKLNWISRFFLKNLSFDTSSIIFDRIKPKNWITNKQPSTFYCTGWYDFFCQGTIDLFIEHGNRSKSKSALVIGPWNHFPIKDSFPIFQNENNLPIDLSAQSWFDQTLKNQNTKSRVGVLYYVIHPEDGGWKHLYKWPVPVEEHVLFFSRPSLTIEHDPVNLVPLVGGWNFINADSGPISQKKMLDHPSVGSSLIEFNPKENVVITGSPTIAFSCVADESTVCMIRICHISKKMEWIPVSHTAKKIDKGKNEYILDCSPISFMLKPGEKIGVIFSSSCETLLKSSSRPTELKICLEKGSITLPIESSKKPHQSIFAP